MTDTVVGGRPRSRSRFANYRWIPWAFVGGFIAIFIANGSLVYFAAESWPGLTTDHAYTEGLAYNQVIQESEKEAKLGWKVDLAFTPRKGAQRGRILIVARDRSGAALDNLMLRGELIRPVEEIADVPIAFVPQGEGRYVATIDPPRVGQWDVYLSARRGGDLWHGGRRILVPEP